MTQRCKACDGMGEIREYMCVPAPGPLSERWYRAEECDACQGSGKEDTE